MKFWAFIIILFLYSCTDYKDFSVNPEDCYAIEITNENKKITLLRDTVWLCSDESKCFKADVGKIEALLNTLRDFQVMGMSDYNPQEGFPINVDIKNKRGKTIKKLSFKPLVGSANIIASRDGGNCWVVGVPGLEINPQSNFDISPNYWKMNLLLDIEPLSFKHLDVENFINPLQSFSISSRTDSFVCINAEKHFVEQKNIINYITSLGSYSAFQFVENFSIKESDKIYKILYVNKNLDSVGINFYKKYIQDGSLDFNLMYFKTNDNSIGTVKYFDFERLLIDAQDLY